MESKPNTPVDLFDRVARDLIEEALALELPELSGAKYQRVFDAMLVKARTSPPMRTRIERICRRVV